MRPKYHHWSNVMPNGLLCYRIMNGKQNSYIKVVKESTLPILKLNFPDKKSFQRCNYIFDFSVEKLKSSLAAVILLRVHLLWYRARLFLIINIFILLFFLITWSKVWKNFLLSQTSLPYVKMEKESSLMFCFIWKTSWSWWTHLWVRLFDKKKQIILKIPADNG